MLENKKKKNHKLRKLQVYPRCARLGFQFCFVKNGTNSPNMRKNIAQKESQKLYPRRVTYCTTFGGHFLRPKSGTENNSPVAQFLTFVFFWLLYKCHFRKTVVQKIPLKPLKQYRKRRSGIHTHTYIYIYIRTYMLGS